MAWNLSGRGLEICSCKIFCPCWLTPDAEPDQGWCSAVLAWDCNDGQSEGVDLSGARFAVVADWPDNFHKGDGKARLYIDSATNEAQQAEIRGIFGGDKEGPIPALWGAVIEEWLTPAVVSIGMDWEQKSVAVGEIGKATMTSLTDPNGNQTHIFNSLSQVALGINRLDIMSIDGSSWADPDLRDWRAADGVHFDFNWAG